MSFRSNLRRHILKIVPSAVGIAVLLGTVGSAIARHEQTSWQRGAPLPVPRTEVAAAVVAGRIAVVGGYLANGASSNRVDVYSPAGNGWSRLPDLPVGVNHSTAAGYRGRLYVVGGYDGANRALQRAWVLSRGRWRSLPRPPEARAAAGAAVIGRRLFVVGGVGPGGLATRALVFHLRRQRWSTIAGPTPREHLAATAAGGRVFAVGGRLRGIDTNLATVEGRSASGGRWQAFPPLPHRRGGTGAAAIRGQIVSVGGEEPSGTIASVYSLDLGTRRWRRLPDLPTPRHGLGVVALGGRVYAIAGGPRPGLFVSDANEYLALR